MEAEAGEALADAHVGVVGGIDRARRHESPAQARRDRIESLHADDFLDQIDVALEVGAEGGHRPGVVGVAGQTETGEDGRGLVVGNAAAGQLVEFREIECHRLGQHGQLAGHHGQRFGRAASEFDNQLHRQRRAVEHALRIHAALEAVGRVRGKRGAPRGAADPRWGEVRRFQEDVGGGFRDAAVRTAHHAAEGEGLARFIGDHAVLGKQRVGLVIEREELLAVLRGADHQRAGDLRGIEGVQRLADLVQHEVGDIDDVVDRAQADRLEPFLQPHRALGDLHTGNPHRGVERAGLRRFDLHAVGGDAVARRDFQQLQRDFQQRRHFPRHAIVAEQVGAVRCDLDFQKDVVVEQLLHGLPDGSVGRQDHQAVLHVREPDFRSGGEHAARLHAAHLRFTDREAAEIRAGEAAGHLVADLVILRAADDLAKLAFAGIDLGHLQLVGIRVLHGFHDLRDHDLVRGHAFHLDAFHFDASEGQKLVQFIRRLALEIHMGRKPVQRNIHTKNSFDSSDSWCLQLKRTA